MFRTAPKDACTPPVTSFRNTSKLDTFFSWMTMRRPGKKGSPLRYTSTLFTAGCESQDALVPGLLMLALGPRVLPQPEPPAPVCRGEPPARDPLWPWHRPHGHTSRAATAAHRGLGTALRGLHTAAPPRQPARCPGRRGSSVRGAPAQAEKRGVTLRPAQQGHGLPGTRGLGAFILRLCHDGKPYRPAFLGKPPRVCPASPREPAGSLPGPEAPREGARGPACPEGAAGAEGTGSQPGGEGDPRSFSSSCSH